MWQSGPSWVEIGGGGTHPFLVDLRGALVRLVITRPPFVVLKRNLTSFFCAHEPNPSRPPLCQVARMGSCRSRWECDRWHYRLCPKLPGRHHLRATAEGWDKLWRPEPCLGWWRVSKAASDLYTPVAGAVLAANAILEQSPETVNKEPFREGWMIRIQPDDGGSELSSWTRPPTPLSRANRRFALGRCWREPRESGTFARKSSIHAFPDASLGVRCSYVYGCEAYPVPRRLGSRGGCLSPPVARRKTRHPHPRPRELAGEAVRFRRSRSPLWSGAIWRKL
jgi:hypothetical protein